VSWRISAIRAVTTESATQPRELGVALVSRFTPATTALGLKPVHAGRCNMRCNMRRSVARREAARGIGSASRGSSWDRQRVARQLVGSAARREAARGIGSSWSWRLQGAQSVSAQRGAGAREGGPRQRHGSVRQLLNAARRLPGPRLNSLRRRLVHAGRVARRQQHIAHNIPIGVVAAGKAKPAWLTSERESQLSRNRLLSCGRPGPRRRSGQC